MEPFETFETFEHEGIQCELHYDADAGNPYREGGVARQHRQWRTSAA